MDIDNALSEPAVRLVEFHNAFNRNVKISFGALESISQQALASEVGDVLALPTGGEPWGRETRWRNLEAPVKDAAGFLAELGLVRATAAFEDFLAGAKAEFDRAGLAARGATADGTSAMDGLDAIFGIAPAAIADLARMAQFFDVARNCVVHRSNRANAQLAALRADAALMDTLDRWPKRIGRWKVSLPAVDEGRTVDWRPRHAIMASDVYYRCAMLLDRRLVTLLGPAGLAAMAAYWCFFADPPVHSPAKLDAGTIVRTQLVNRYKARATTLAETIEHLRTVGRWDEIRTIFDRLYPNGPETSLARKRRVRKSGRRR